MLHEFPNDLRLRIIPNLKYSATDRSKAYPNANRKGDELKNEELRTEIIQGDKVKHRPKRTAAAEAGNKILGQTLKEE